MKALDAKIYSLEQLEQKLPALRADKQKLVFTNGCFDLIHLGHLQLLTQAKALGDFLIVGLNSDESVRRLKGPERPIKDEVNRAALLGALEAVDAVILFAEDTPLELIKSLLPDVLCKGGDWLPEQIVGADIVLARGGQVKSLPFLPNHSTTALANKIKGDSAKG